MTDKKLMKQAKKRVYAKTAFAVHATISVGVGLLLVLLYFATTPGEAFWPVWPLLGLGIGVLAHATSFASFFNSRQRIQAEYERLKRMQEGG